MKYWLYFAAKLLVGGGLMAALQYGVLHLYPIPKQTLGLEDGLFLRDLGFTFLVLAVWFVGVALLFFIVWDQKRRCPACLRRLVMPLASGYWSSTIFGRPRTEWICGYGHGTLIIEELQITGRQLPDWDAHNGDIWKELESYYQARK
jgi:hypothetical protein